MLVIYLLHVCDARSRKSEPPAGSCSQAVIDVRYRYKVTYGVKKFIEEWIFKR